MKDHVVYELKNSRQKNDIAMLSQEKLSNFFTSTKHKKVETFNF